AASAPSAQRRAAGQRVAEQVMDMPDPMPTPPTEGSTDGGGQTSGSDTDGASSGVTVLARQVAEVTRRLVEEGALATDPQLKVRVTALLSVVLGDSISGRASAIDVNLPDLEEETVAAVIGDNVISCAPLYMAAMLEDYKFFAAGDYVAHTLFMQGVLP